MNGIILITALFSTLEGKNAYLDPGSGSLILQVILAALLGGFFIIRSSWQKIKDGLLSLFGKQRTDEGDEVDET